MNNIYEPKFVKQLFNQMSGSYERMNYITSFGFSIRWRKQFLNKLGKSNEKLSVIDLLSGLGENWTYLKQNFPNSNFSALDFSEEMIAHSKNKANKVFRNQLNLLCENILQSNLESDFFDVVSCAYGLKTFNSQQLEILAKEVSRILKPNGKFSFVEVSKPRNKILYSVYKFYLGKMIPVLGKLFLGNPNDYKMLWVYTENFENCNRVKEIFEKHHLKVNIESYFYGCATGIHGEKMK
ncbi:class I SAM-dependent methyltransferase [Chryseobacterium sp. Ch-15]|uniref:Class I SAM-dependent methyltransferase n=1 Tax=Chryseobacterium muglaense TaxID=2893752 RepID=A0A9Q3YT98_9FLAO|nr:class I SAM-dependent methyltransferase [Chryseobacterium muglaense]MBD3903525.1 class I SAM-dependent methyltransferase [Chryseobacterium muglaense]MCC9034597.1 class I SAM-dependent methyltransferase [Chryseobacterium muglaense]MCM2552860.1 class I SAM-dependent methyltransferase [Chryseobacterium muglaense]